MFSTRVISSRRLVGDFADDGWHTRQASSLCRSPAAFAGKELKPRARWAQNQRLDDSGRLYRLGEFRERLFAKARTRLIRARLDQVNIHELRTRGSLSAYRGMRFR